MQGRQHSLAEKPHNDDSNTASVDVPQAQYHHTITMRVTEENVVHPNSKSISTIQSSREARKVINELMRKGSASTLGDSSRASRKRDLRDVELTATEREAEKSRGNGAVRGVKSQFGETVFNKETHNEKCDILTISDTMPRNFLDRNSSLRRVAGRLLSEDGPRRSKSETSLDHSLPELDAAQKSSSLTQLVTLSPKADSPRLGKQYTPLARAGAENALSHDCKGAGLKSPGHFTRMGRMHDKIQSQTQLQQRQKQRYSQRHSSQAFASRLRSQSESCLLQPGKHRKPPSRATTHKSSDITSGIHFSPGSERLYMTRENRGTFGRNPPPPPRARVMRERSFDMTFPGYDVRYDLPVELPQLSDMEKEIEADFKKKSIEKCQYWMNRWVPNDI